MGFSCPSSRDFGMNRYSMDQGNALFFYLWSQLYFLDFTIVWNQGLNCTIWDAKGKKVAYICMCAHVFYLKIPCNFKALYCVLWWKCEVCRWIRGCGCFNRWESWKRYPRIWVNNDFRYWGWLISTSSPTCCSWFTRR